MRTKTLMFLITYQCNLRCSYCYEPKVIRPTVTAARLKELIRTQIDALPDVYDSFEIHFMGGEPLLEFDMIKDVSEWLWAQKTDKRLSMIYAPTNGTLVNGEIKRWCIDNKDRFCLGLSFDGDIEMQNLNRSNSSESIDLDFFAHTWPKQSVKLTLSPATIKGMANGVRYLHKKGFSYVVADLARGSRIDWRNGHIKELSRQLDELSIYYSESEEDNHMSMLDIDIFGIDSDFRDSHKSCSCGEDLSCIDTDGTSYGCHLFSPVALPKEKARQSLDFDFGNHEYFQNKVCRKCVLNSICNHCYGMNFICLGDVSTPDPFHCAVFKTIYVANCRHNLRMASKRGNNEALVRISNLINLISHNNEN